MIYLRTLINEQEHLCILVIRWLYFVVSWGGKAGTLFLLNVTDSSGAPVGCVRTDAQTQASHWLELGGHSAVSPAPLSCYRVFCLPTVRRSPVRRERNTFLSFYSPTKSPSNCASARTGHFSGGKHFSRQAKWISTEHWVAQSFQWISAQWKYRGNQTTFESSFTPHFSVQTGFYHSHGEKNDPRSALCSSVSFR